jgi:hypothetical protein
MGLVGLLPSLLATKALMTVLERLPRSGEDDGSTERVRVSVPR